jgi:3-hydroxybutyryl-CoA dehydrogenase
MALEVIKEHIENFGLSKKNRPKVLFSKVGLVGCGAVGQHIAIMISRAGIEVHFIELNDATILKATGRIEKELDTMIDRWGMTGSEKKSILSRIKGASDWSSLRGCDLVIESVKSRPGENSLLMRQEIFKKIEENVDEETIIASNSTTIVITELASVLKFKERCISMFFSTTNPDSPIIEIVKGLHTTYEVAENVEKFMKLINKVGIAVAESPGLISVRIFAAMINEACEVLMEGVADKEDIDQTMRYNLGLLLGPFEMADKIGLDKIVKWMENLYYEFGDLKYKPSPVIKRLVRANSLGRITGHGFYSYDADGKKIG